MDSHHISRCLLLEDRIYLLVRCAKSAPCGTDWGISIFGTNDNCGGCCRSDKGGHITCNSGWWSYNPDGRVAGEQFQSIGTRDKRGCFLLNRYTKDRYLS